MCIYTRFKDDPSLSLITSQYLDSDASDISETFNMFEMCIAYCVGEMNCSGENGESAISVYELNIYQVSLRSVFVSRSVCVGEDLGTVLQTPP